MRFFRSKKILQLDDAATIVAYRETPDPIYIGALFDRYCHLVFAVSMNYLKNEEESKDAVLHIFEKLPEYLLKYDIRNFSLWLYSITKNHCLKQLREKNLRVLFVEEKHEPVVEEEVTDSALTDQMLLRLPEAVASLNEPQQKCVKLFYLEEKSYKEIEVITGYSYDKVKSCIQNGKRNLKIFLLNLK